MRVAIKNLTKRFGSTLALRDVSLEVASQELFFLLGPSGCGKTTLLRLMAGFYEADEGTLTFGDRPLAGVPPHQRNTGMVFQNYALWPHLTVAQNVAYGLEARSVAADQKKQRVAEALDIVQMAPYADRSPNQLSGGQQQRVALARALVIRPDVLLLDEPLSNLDARLRLEMREEIRRIHSQTRITMIYVTHDQKEALSLASRLAVLREGVIEQVGAPRDVYRSPANRFVADFIGESNWLAATVISTSSSGILVDTAAGRFHAQPEARPASGLRTGRGPATFQPGQKVEFGFRPEAVRMGPGPENNLPTVVRSVSYLGEIEQYRLEIHSGIELKAFEQNPLELRAPGQTLPVHVRAQDCLVLPA